MRLWLIVAVSVLVLGTSALETIQVAFFQSAGDCGGNEDPCPPFSDDCHDCAQCAHVNALPAAFAGVVLALTPVSCSVVPALGEGHRPDDAPPHEILTVPRA